MYIKNTLLLILTAALLLWLAACGGETTLIQRANQFDGGALSNFGGVDGNSADARAIAREIASGRSYDFTQSGFEITPGGVESSGPGGSLFGVGAGTLALNGDNVTVNMEITSADPNVTNAHMTGTFSLAQASSAIINPGASFVVNWLLNFDALGSPVSLSADQTLNGTDFTSL